MLLCHSGVYCNERCCAILAFTVINAAVPFGRHCYKRCFAILAFIVINAAVPFGCSL